MTKVSISIIFLLLLLVKCQPPPEAPVGIDPDIVLINVENGDREFIGKILHKIDSLNPIAVGIDITFQSRTKNDTALIAALKKLKNDILVCNVKQNSQIDGSDSVFTSLTEQGNLYYEQKLGLITTTVPLRKINNTVYESLAFKILKRWKPDSVSKIKVDERIDIHYTRNLDKLTVIKGSDLLNTNVTNLSNKIFLVGYLDPEKGDKHFTPLRNKGLFKTDEPDAYGLVIIANEIRTILEYNNL